MKAHNSFSVDLWSSLFKVEVWKSRKHDCERCLNGFSVPCAGEVIHKYVDRGTHAATHLRHSREKIEGICKLSPSSQSRLKHRNNSKDDDGNGKYEEFDGQSDEHFGDAALFAGQTGRHLAAPTNDMGQSNRCDDGRYQ